MQWIYFTSQEKFRSLCHVLNGEYLKILETLHNKTGIFPLLAFIYKPESNFFVNLLFISLRYFVRSKYL